MEEATDGQQIAEALPPAAETTEEPKAEPKPKSGFQEKVDLSDLPEDKREQIEGRLAHLSRLMKKNEIKYGGEINRWRDVASEQSKLIDELRTGMGAVVDHLQDGSLKDAEARTKAELKAAHEAGDTMAFIEANDKLAEIKARKIALEQQKKAVKQEKPKDDDIKSSASEMANDSFNSGEITESDLRAVNSWVGEADESGNPMRAWATSRNQSNPTADPVYRRAVIEMAAVFDEASPFADKPINEKLDEIDRRMGVAKRNGSQAVMGGQLTVPRKSSKITLSPEAEKLAVRTKFGGPKAKSDADHIAAYVKQMETVRAQKGSRK